jgi:sulfur-oxidizing protein SoxX
MLLALLAAAGCTDLPPRTGDGVAKYVVTGDGIDAPLDGRVGDATRGRALIVARSAANCVLCHAIPDPELRFAGDVGPSLAGVGTRLSTAQLRLRVVDMQSLAPRTPMPSYHRIDGLADVAPAWRGRPLLTAGEVEDIVAYLSTLR